MTEEWQRDTSCCGVTEDSSSHRHSSSMCISWERGRAGWSNMRELSFGNADSSFSAGSGPSGRAGPWWKQAQLPEGIEIQCWAGGSWGSAVQTYAKNYFQNHPECQKGMNQGQMLNWYKLVWPSWVLPLIYVFLALSRPQLPVAPMKKLQISW